MLNKPIYETINPGSVKYTKLYDREDVTNKLFKWVDNIYKKRLFRKPKLVVKNGFVYLPLVANDIDNVKFIQNYCGCKCVYLLNDLSKGNHDICYQFDVEYAAEYSESKIFIKPRVEVYFIDGTHKFYHFDEFRDAENFNQNIQNHPTSYHYAKTV